MQISTEKVHQMWYHHAESSGARTEGCDATRRGGGGGGGRSRFRYRGRRSEIGGRRTRNDGRRTPGWRGGKKGAAAWEWSILLVRQVPTRIAKDGSRSTRNWTFSICKSDEKLASRTRGERAGGGGHTKWFPVYWCLASSVSSYRVSICLVPSAGFLPVLCGTARMSFRKIHVHTWHITAMGKIRSRLKFGDFHKLARVRNADTQFQHFVTRSVLSGLFQYIWQRTARSGWLYTSEAIKFILQIGLAFKFHYLDFESNFSVVKIHRSIDTVRDTKFALC